MLHEVTARVVDDERVGDPVLAKLPLGEKPLIARTRLFDPDVKGNAFVVRLINGRKSGPVVDRGEPPGVAVREDVQRPALFLIEFAKHAEPRLADAAAALHVLLRHLFGEANGREEAVLGLARQKSSEHARHRPREIHRRGTGVADDFGRLQKRLVVVTGLEREHHAPGSGDADEGRPAHPHVADGLDRVLPSRENATLKAEGKQRLIDDFHRFAAFQRTDAAGGKTVNFHKRKKARNLGKKGRPKCGRPSIK